MKEELVDLEETISELESVVEMDMRPRLARSTVNMSFSMNGNDSKRKMRGALSWKLCFAACAASVPSWIFSKISSSTII